jgi:hypothetical protein
VDSLAAASTASRRRAAALTPARIEQSFDGVEHAKTKRDAAKRASSGLRLNVSEPCVGSLGESE